MRYYLFCLLLCCAVIPGESGPIPAEIAGRYRDDVTDFSYFSVGTDGTYTNAVYLCSRGNSREVGTATFTNNIVHLLPNDPKRERTTLLAVAWGGRQYLVNTNYMHFFLSSISDGTEPRAHDWGSFPLREGDWEIKVSGNPNLPPDWQKLLPKPMTGKVTEVIDGSSAWINLGSEHGLLAGMEVRGKNSGGYYEYSVEQVYGRQSRIKVRNKYGKLEVGQKITTKSRVDES